MDEEMGEDLPAREEEDEDSEGDEEFDWIVENDGGDDDDDEEDDGDVDEDEDDDDPLVTEQFENFEVDTPPERSGHIAVVDRNCMYVWGGYKVRFPISGICNSTY